MSNSKLSIDWLAGFYEGDGYPHSGRSFGLHVCQKDREVLDIIQNTYNGKVYAFKNYSDWQLFGKPAVDLALNLIEHMHHPGKIEQLKKSLIIKGHIEPRSEEERIQVAEHKKKTQTYYKTYHERHKEEQQARLKKHYDENKEKYAINNKTRYEKRKEEAKQIREYMKQHPELVEALKNEVSNL